MVWRLPEGEVDIVGGDEGCSNVYMRLVTAD